MGLAVRSINNTRSSINTVSNISDQETDLHIMIKNLQGSHTKLQQLFNVTKAISNITSNNKRDTNHNLIESSF